LNNGAFALIDTAISGFLVKALTGNYTLTTANGATDEARNAAIMFTGTGAFTVTIPSVSKKYDIWNTCTGVLTISNGSASVTVQPGAIASIVTDGGANMARHAPSDFNNQNLINIGSIAMNGPITGCTSLTGLALPTTANQAASKQYVDNAVSTAVWTIAGGISITPPNAGMVLTNNGTTPSWTNSLSALTVTNLTATSLTVGGAPVATAQSALVYALVF
jgi:hypothetical protein